MSTTTTTNVSEPVRKLDFLLDKLPDSSVVVPSVGVDFGSFFVRVAVLSCRDDKEGQEQRQGVDVKLATFPITDAVAALRYAHAALSTSTSTLNSKSKTEEADKKKLKVFYTGHATEEHVKLIQQTFPNACVERRDKMVCHTKGAHLLISSDLPQNVLYHETTEAEEALQKLLSLYEKFKLFMPPKMLEVFTNISNEAVARNGAKFPLTLSIVGSNNIICNLSDDSSFKVFDVHCNAGHSMQTLWKLAKTSTCPGDFDSFLQLAENGNRRGVDSCTSEIAEAIGFYSAMPPDYPIFSFGKLEHRSRHDVKPEDLARAVAGWHTDLVMMKTTDAAMFSRAFPIYFTGSLVQHDFVRCEMLLRNNLSAFNGMTMPQFFKTDATAALGACL